MGGVKIELVEEDIESFIKKIWTVDKKRLTK